MKTCCFCKKEINVYGNNPYPYKGEVCCDRCNINKVIPSRLILQEIAKQNIQKQ